MVKLPRSIHLSLSDCKIITLNFAEQENTVSCFAHTCMRDMRVLFQCIREIDFSGVEMSIVWIIESTSPLTLSSQQHLHDDVFVATSVMLTSVFYSSDQKYHVQANQQENVTDIPAIIALSNAVVCWFHRCTAQWLEFHTQKFDEKHPNKHFTTKENPHCVLHVLIFFLDLCFLRRRRSLRFDWHGQRKGWRSSNAGLMDRRCVWDRP